MIKSLGSNVDLSQYTPVDPKDPALQQHLRENYELTRPPSYTNEELNEIGRTGMPQGKETVYGINAIGLAEGKRKQKQEEHDINAMGIQYLINNGGIQVHRHNKTGEYGHTKTENYDQVVRDLNAMGSQRLPASAGRQFADPTSMVSTGHRPFNRDGSARMIPASIVQMNQETGEMENVRGFAPVNPLAAVVATDGKWEKYLATSAENAAKRRAEWEEAKRQGRVFSASEFPGWQDPEEKGEMVETNKYPHAIRPSGPLERVVPTPGLGGQKIDVGSRPALDDGETLESDVVKRSELGGPTVPESTGGTSVPAGAGIFTPGGPGLYDIEKQKASAVSSAARKMRHGLQQVTARPAVAEEVAAEANLRAAEKEARSVEQRQKTIEAAQGDFNRKLEQEQIKHVFNPNKPELGHHFFDISEGDDEDSPLIASVSHNVWINRDWGGREADDIGLSQVDNAGNEIRQKSEAETFDPKNIWDSIGSYREGVKLIQRHMKETHGVDVPVKHMMSWYRANGVLPKLHYKCTGENCGAVVEESKLNDHTHRDGSKPVFVGQPSPESRGGGTGSMWPARAIDATVNIIRQLRNSQQDITLPANPNKGRAAATVVPKEPVITYGPEEAPVKDESGAVLYKPCNNTRGVKGVNSGNPCSVATAAIKGKQKAQVNSEKICPGCTKPKEVLTAPTGRIVRKEVRPEGGQGAVKLRRGWKRFDLQGLADHSVKLANEALAQKVSRITEGRRKAAETRRRGGAAAVAEAAGATAALEAARDAAGTAVPLSPPNSDGEPTSKNPMGHAFTRNGEHNVAKCNACRIAGPKPTVGAQLKNYAAGQEAIRQSGAEVAAHYDELADLEKAGHTLTEVDVTKNTAPITSDPMKKMLSRKNPKYAKFHDETKCVKCKEDAASAQFEATEEPKA